MTETDAESRKSERFLWGSLVTRTILPAALTVILFISAIYLIALPSLENTIPELKREKLRDLTDLAIKLIGNYEDRVRAGELTLEDAQAIAVERIRMLRYGREGEDYFWINDYEPRMIMHPYRPDLEGLYLGDMTDLKGKKLFAEIARVARESGGGFVEYLWQDREDSSRVVAKYSYVRGFEPWGWVVGTGIYLDEVGMETSALTKRINIAFLIIMIIVISLSIYIINEGRKIEKRRIDAERNLRKNERRFRSIGSSAMDAIIMTDSRGKVSYWNEAAEKILGYSVSEAAGRELSSLIIPPQQRSAHEKMIAGFVADGNRPNLGKVMEMTAVRKDGTEFPVEITISSFQLEGEWNIVGIVRDISKRKEAEMALLDSKQRMDLHVMKTPMGVIDWDTGFRVIEWNPSAQRIFGYSREEALGKSARELIIPEDVATHVDKIWSSLLEQTGGQRSSNMNVTKDGRIIICEWYNTTLIDPDGKVIGVASLVQDVTEIKVAEDEIRKQSAALQQTLEGICITDLKRRVQFANKAFVEMHGYKDPQEFAGSDISIFHTLEQMENEMAPLLEMVERTGAGESRIGHKRRDGKVFPTRMTITILKNDSGEKVGMIATAQDISERLLLEQQLMQSQRVEAIGRLAGGIAHDFNNLLSPILGYTELLLASIPAGGQGREEIEEIQNAAGRARDLTRQLLAFGRKQFLEVKVLNLNGVVSGFEKILQRMMRENIELDIKLGKDVENIRADATQVEMIIMNLILNALDAMPDGGRLTIETGGAVVDHLYAESHPGVTPGRYMTLSVSDTGSGMDKETVDRVFEPFFTTKEPGHGTGLGLPTVYGSVKQHGGHIWLYSEPGLGTVIKIYLPAVDEEITAEKTDEEAGVESAGGKTILVVEDNAMVGNLVRRILTNHGYNVISTRNPAEAISKVKDPGCGVDLLLTDVVMPGMNGRDLYLRLLDVIPSIRVIYMSGYTDDVILGKGVLEKGFHFIQKPFTNRQLLSKVRSVLS